MSANHYAVSGTRTDLTDADRALIRFVLRDFGLDDTEGRDMLHVGDCPTGVDAYVWEAVDGWPLQVKEHEADWGQHGKAAGPIRNREMLDDEPHQLVQCFAFPRKGQANRGTRDFIKACLEREQDVRVIWLWPEGFWDER